MLKLTVSLGMLLGAVSAFAQPLQPSPIHGDTPGHACRTSGTNKFIGKPGTRMMGAAVKDVTRAAVLRWAPPGTMLTMDYRADRVTVYLDGRKTITKITCG
jgi:hypothetical protein